MRRAIDTSPRGDWPPEKSIGTVTIDFESRHRRRIRLACDDGDDLLLDLERATALRDGDGLRLANGDWVEVRAANEALMDIGCDDAHHLLRVAWHLGNRHCPAAILDDRIVTRDDHVIASMVEGLGATVTRRLGPFEPEGGAYGAHHGHGNGHADDG